MLNLLLQSSFFFRPNHHHAMASNLFNTIAELTHSLSLSDLTSLNVLHSDLPTLLHRHVTLPNHTEHHSYSEHHSHSYSEHHSHSYSEHHSYHSSSHCPCREVAVTTLPTEAGNNSSLLFDDSTTTKLPTSYNINSLFHVPMNKTDFICWKSHFLRVLQLHELKYVFDESAPPTTSTTSEPNPDYTNLVKADQLVLMWIRSTVSTSVQTMILHCSTAIEAWMLLENFLSPLCSIHVKTLRAKLQTTWKQPTTSMSEFLMDVKTNVDALCAVGSSVLDEDVINYIMDGLDST